MSLKKFDRNNLPHELLLTTRQRIKLRNVFNNNMLAGTKLSKAQISKIIQSGEFLSKIAVPLTKNILVPLGTTAAASAIDSGIQNKIHGSGVTALIISNEAMNDIMKIIQALRNLIVYSKELLKPLKMK